MKEFTRLEQVSFGVQEESHKLHFKSKKYRERVLGALLANNVKLKFVDNVRKTENLLKCQRNSKWFQDTKS